MQRRLWQRSAQSTRRVPEWSGASRWKLVTGSFKRSMGFYRVSVREYCRVWRVLGFRVQGLGFRAC